MCERAGIMTFHRSRNYGAVLQAYALQKRVQQYYKVDIIDYQNDKIDKELKLWTGSLHKEWKQQIRALFTFFFRWRKKIVFDRFIDRELVCSKRVGRDNLKEMSKHYDLLITGSDQVWNNELTDIDNSYFLNFASEKVKKIAYAVSMGDVCNGINNEQIALIEGYQLVTVREKQAAKYLETKLKKNIRICCDPTLLLHAEEWEKIISPKLEKRKYIFLFMIEEQQDLIEYALKIAQREQAKLVSSKKAFSFWLHSSPNDFLSWIFHAEYVVTNSFHGTIFSLLFHKPFAYSKMKKGFGLRNRITDLLMIVHLENRFIENNRFKIESLIDWDIVDECIQNYREESWTILRSVLLEEIKQ